MKQGYFWPVYGERDEIVFTHSTSRGRARIERVLKEQFSGAQCWVCSSRHYLEAENQEPEAVRRA